MARMLVSVERKHPHATSANILRQLFYPSGELSPEYVQFQMCDSVQAMCSYLRGTLTMHATLTAAGLGSSESAALSTVATFLLKDGSGMIAGLVFSYFFSRGFDDETRFWRLFADVINDVGLTLELAAPLFGPYFLAVTAAANVCKALCGVAAGATRAAVSSHFALSGNVAEVQAKEGVQETFVTLLGMVAGYGLVAWLPHAAKDGAAAVQDGTGKAQSGLVSAQAAAWLAFTALTLLHVAANWLGMRLLALRTLNRSRVYALRRHWEAQGHKDGQVLSPVAMRYVDPLVLPPPYAGRLYRAMARLTCWSRGGVLSQSVQTRSTRGVGGTRTVLDFSPYIEPCDIRVGVELAEVLAAAGVMPATNGRTAQLTDVRPGARAVVLTCTVGKDGQKVFKAVPLHTMLAAAPLDSSSTTPIAATPATPASARKRRGSASGASSTSDKQLAATRQKSPARGRKPAVTASVVAALHQHSTVDGVVIGWCPAGHGWPGLTLPAILTGRPVATTVRIACLDGVTPETLLAAYCCALNVLAGLPEDREGSSGTEGTGRRQSVHRLDEVCRDIEDEAGTALHMYAAAAGQGWQTADVWLGDEGCRYQLLAA